MIGPKKYYSKFKNIAIGPTNIAFKFNYIEIDQKLYFQFNYMSSGPILWL